MYSKTDILFESSRLIVKRFSREDADLFFAINGDPEMMRYIRPPKTRPESDLFLSENIDAYKDGSVKGRFAVFEKSDHRFIGTFSLLLLDGEMGYHIGYALLPPARGKGFATELVKEGAAYFFAQVPGQEKLYAVTVEANTGSQKVLLRAGFCQEGIIRQHGEELQLFSLKRQA